MAKEGGSFKSFVSEAEIDEKRKKRQEEWEKVRTEDQPQECPEEDTDMRCLYDKLQEQNDKKQEDFEEQFKFKNMVRGIDEEESKFLDEVADRQMELETRRWKEENEMVAEIKQYTDRVIPIDDTKKRVSVKPQSAAEVSATAKTGTSSTSRRSQATLLAGAVKRKRNTSEGTNGEEKKVKSAPSTSTNPKPLSHSPTELLQDSSSESVTTNDVDRPARSVNNKAHVVSILPGLGFYTNSSDSDTSSSDSEVDLLNSVIHRAIKKKSCHST
ncbi:PSME3-interacting protein-like [Asterias amurensis]|uniref:PSME3-interacting protein-like n=1 Tax=Asterias amurensis TaxID=7602 RepID=UPI003AB76C27